GDRTAAAAAAVRGLGRGLPGAPGDVPALRARAAPGGHPPVGGRRCPYHCRQPETDDNAPTEVSVAAAGSWLKRNALLVLLVFVPGALLVEHIVHGGGLAVFVTSALASIPLSGLMGRATEHLAAGLGEGVGGRLITTFGNAAELIIAIVALREGLYDLVKASITGSIIGNILLVFGLGALYGGLKHQTQRFNATAASLSGTLLVLSAIGLVIPAIFHLLVRGAPAAHELELSLEIAIVLMATY